MSIPLTRRQTPEERELENKRARLAALETELAQHELDLATLKAELQAFEARYLREVGMLNAELDDIEAQIAEAQARLNPQSQEAQEQAAKARTQAHESAQAAGATQERGEQKKFTAPETLKKLYREVAKSIHPDLATDDAERVRRQRMMAEANQAYAEGEETRLQAILRGWESRPESIKGEGVGAELIRVIRKIAQMEERLQAIEAEMTELKASDLSQLKAQVEEAEREGRDVLAVMAVQIKQQIAEAKTRLAAVTTGNRGLTARSSALVRRGLEALRSQKPRVVRFPADCSMGMLYINKGDPSRDAWEELGEARGDITVDAGKEIKLGVFRESSTDLSPLAALASDDLYGLHLPTPINDNELAHLQGLTALRTLSLRGTKVTDAGLAYLQWLTKLEVLNLRMTQVTDAGLAHLQGLSALQELNLSHTRVTDAGLAHLQGLTSLRTLNLWDTKVTNAGLAHLRRLTALQELSLGGTKVVDAGLVHLHGLSALRELHLGYTKVTDAGLIHLRRLTALQELSLGGTKAISQNEYPASGCSTGSMRMSHFGRSGLRSKRASTTCIAVLLSVTPFV